MIMENLKSFFNGEITPHEFAKIMDEAYFIISQMAIANPNALPQCEYPTDELLLYMHKFKNVCNSR